MKVFNVIDEKRVTAMAALGAKLAPGWCEVLQAALNELAGVGIDRQAAIVGLRLAVEQVTLRPENCAPVEPRIVQ